MLGEDGLTNGDLKMERRIGLRGRTDFSVTANDGFLAHQARCIELSGSGIVLERGYLLSDARAPLTMRLEIRLPERRRPIQVIARHVRCAGTTQALRFVQLSDADRLCLAEHLDLIHRRGDRLN